MPVKQRRIFVFIIIVHVVLTALHTSRQNVLFDEPDYYSYTFSWAKGHPERNSPMMDSKTPMMVFSLGPVVLKPILPAHLIAGDRFYFLKAGRPFMYVYAFLGAFVVFCWLYRKCGERKWIVPLLFFCFDPLVFAYGMVIGSDLACAALLVTIMYAAWRYAATKSNRYWWIVCIAAALAVVTKASMVYCYPLLLLLFVGRCFITGRIAYKKAFLQAIHFILIQLLVINLAYYGKGIFAPLNHLAFSSHFFSGVQSAMHLFGGFPVPLPAPFIQGFDMLQYHAEIGGCKPESTYGGVSFLNEVYCDRSVWYYYLGSAIFKFPLFVWLFIIVAFVNLVLIKNKREVLSANIFTWLPFLYFLCILSFANKFQIGIRHAMLLMPFIYIAISGSINNFRTRYQKLFYALLLLHVISVGRYIPNMIAYTNELVWNKTKAFKILRDSSLDYGQSNAWADAFIQKNPAYKKPTNMPDTGRFAITVSNLFTTQEGPLKNIAWLRENFEPVGNYRYTILLFDVSAKDLTMQGLKIP